MSGLPEKPDLDNASVGSEEIALMFRRKGFLFIYNIKESGNAKD